MLAECRECGRKVSTGARVCPHCGIRSPRRSPVVWIAPIAGAAAVVILVVGGLLLSVPSEPVQAGVSNPAPDPVRAEAGAPVAPDVAARPPEDAAPSPAPPADPDEPVPSSAPVPAAPVDLQVRWTNTWANLRAGRSTDSAIVRVLRPGDRVEVRDRRRGWWRVYLDGAAAGYMANSVLSDVPLEPDRPDR